jgi:hypothetical protein
MLTVNTYYLGSNFVDGKIKYYYICDNQSKSIDLIDSSEISLYETSQYTPSINTYRPRYKNNWLNLLGFNLNDDFKVIYIPKGTIKYDCNFGLN